MTLLALLLVTLSAFIHAFWNFITKRQNPSAAFFLMTSLVSVLIFFPLLLIYRQGLSLIPPIVWGLIAATGIAQAFYYIALAAAYRNGDLSLAYPLARSLPVVLVALVSVLIGRGQQIGPLAYAGFAVVTAGCMILPLPSFRDFQWKHYRNAWLLFASLAAVCITVYTLLDDQSLRVLRALPDSPLTNFGWTLLFVELEGISLTLALGITLLCYGPERRALFQANRSTWRTAAWLGLIIPGGYALVLLALAYVSNVSYVFAFRQLSIPIGAALGMLIRKEPPYFPKLVGVAAVVLGLVLVAVG
jgi:drug/metabolite transporter (DMT)-like permease